mgnify:CR=1 FL=1
MDSQNLITPIIDYNLIQESFNLIESSNQILITTHLSPDGDAMGSSLGLYHFLKQIDKEVKIIVPNSFPYFLKWMEGSEDILIYEYNPKAAETIFNKSDLIFSLDYNIPKRIGPMSELLENATAKKILIDHHLYPGDIFDVIISFPNISSTSELIFRFLYQADKIKLIDKKISECIYTGMMTDTGGFTFNSNSPDIYQIISLLLTKGIDKDKIYSLVFNNLSESRFRLLGFTLSQRMKIYPELNSALLWLSKSDQEQFEFSKGDTEGFVNYPLGIKNIVFSVFIREDKELIKISFRSQGTFPANEFAKEFFNGGGHLNASGGEFYGELDDAIALFERGLDVYKEKLTDAIK